MRTIQELRRVAAPVQRPHSLTWDGQRFFVSSIAERSLSALRPDFSMEWQVPAPGTPWGTCFADDCLYSLCGEGPDDMRYLRKCSTESEVGYDPDWRRPAPEDTGSQLSWYAGQLHLSQWYRKQILVLDLAEPATAEPAIQGTFLCPHGVAGHVFANGTLWVLGTDAESTTDYFLTQVDPISGAYNTVAHVPFQARGLAFDGDTLWTCHREAHQLVQLAAP
jgi:hypothetical protein